MAKKIILFLSLLSEDESKRKTKDYACAAGVLGMDEAHEITGTQTNEAPVKAMLLAHPDVRSIICIVTPQAKKSTLDFFKTFWSSHEKSRSNYRTISLRLLIFRMTRCLPKVRCSVF